MQCSLCGVKALCPGSVSGCCVDVSVWPHAVVVPGCRSASGVMLRRGFATGRALCGFIAWFVCVLRGFPRWCSSSVDIERSVADSSALSLPVLCCCPVPCALALSRVRGFTPHDCGSSRYVYALACGDAWVFTLNVNVAVCSTGSLSSLSRSVAVVHRVGCLHSHMRHGFALCSVSYARALARVLCSRGCSSPPSAPSHINATRTGWESAFSISAVVLVLLSLASTSTFITTRREESQTPVSVSISHRLLLPLSLTPSQR